MKLKRGQKLCKNCNKINGARAYICKHCNTEFQIGINAKNKFKRKRIKKFEDIDWQSIEKGTRIKVLSRSGTYYINQDGDKQYMSDPGIYTIVEKQHNGLLVHSKEGYSFIYMGPEKKSPLMPNMYNAPHKIMKVNVPERLIV